MRTLDSRVNTTMKVKQDLGTYQKDYQNQKHRHREQRTPAANSGWAAGSAATSTAG